jgi:hypothetical protein
MIGHCFAAQQQTACGRDDRRTDAASSVLFLNPHCLINHKSRRLVGDMVQLRRGQVVCAAIVDAISMTSLKAGTA